MATETTSHPPRTWNPRTWQHRRPGHVLPFRIPFFRIFYSSTYTVLFILAIILLAITPASLIWNCIENNAFQYIFMIGGTYVLTVILAIFLYSSRIWTNRRALAEVGKAYIPVEEGELGRTVRKMVRSQMERSCVVAWESRPRDLEGEILRAEKEGVLPAETMSLTAESYTVGTIIEIDPAYPPWGHVAHAGWSNPSTRRGGERSHVQYTTIFAELPNLLEARAVSLAPADPLATPMADDPTTVMADPVVVEVLRRPESMGMRDYLTQLTYLGIINPPELGAHFLRLYERARFSGTPVSEHGFEDLMTAFAHLLDGMGERISPEIVKQIRLQSGVADLDEGVGAVPNSLMYRIEHESATSPLHHPDAVAPDAPSPAPSQAGSIVHHRMVTPSPSRHSHDHSSSLPHTPVTAQTAPSTTFTPYPDAASAASTTSFGSVVRNSPCEPAMRREVGYFGSEHGVSVGAPLSSERAASSFTEARSRNGSDEEGEGDVDEDVGSTVLTGEGSSSLLESRSSDGDSLRSSDAGSVVVRTARDGDVAG